MTPSTNGKGIVLQERDYGLLADLLDSRLMTLKHAAALHFEGSVEAAKKRIQRLKTAGMIVERPRRPNAPAVHHLGRTGYFALKSTGRIDSAHDPGWAKLYKRQRTSDLMLRHELAVMDVKVALVRAIRNDPTLELIELSTNPDRHRFRVVEAVPAHGGVHFRSLWIKPDCFLYLGEPGEDGVVRDRRYFIEVDMGTESTPRLLRKLRQYGNLHRRTCRDNGTRSRRSRTRDSQFAVVLIFASHARRDNTRKLIRDSFSRKNPKVWCLTLDQPCPIG